VEKPLPPKTFHGIHLPESVLKKPNFGTVIAVGPGRWNSVENKHIPMNVKVGDKVLASEWGGNTIKVLDKDLHVFREDELLGIVELAEEEEPAITKK